MTDTHVVHNPYLTKAVAFTGTRGTGYTSTAVVTTDDTITISTYEGVAEHIDEADLAQKTFTDWMAVATDMAQTLDEYLETTLFASYSQMTTFDNSSIGGSAGNIVVSEANIDDIIVNVKAQIAIAKGLTKATRNGIFIVWNPTNYAQLEKLCASKGFNFADNALKNGIMNGFRYYNVEHYVSEFLTAGHGVAGVKKCITAGICQSTYGKVKEIINPVVSSAQISGLGLESRVDIAFKVWNNDVPIVFNILTSN